MHYEPYEVSISGLHNPFSSYDPIDARYWDPQDLRAEVEYVFKLCADCRLCNKFCGSFPKLFEAVDSYCTEPKYFEVEIEKFKTEDLKEVVDLCFQCKLILLHQLPLYARRPRMGY